MEPRSLALDMLLQAKNDQDLPAALSAVTKSFGFDRYRYVCHIRLNGGKFIERAITDYPPEWVIQTKELGYDPVISLCVKRVTPLVWDRAFLAATEHCAFFQEIRQFGLKGGVTFPVHGRYGDTSILSLNADSDGSATKKKVDACMAEGHLITCYAHELLRDILLTKIETDNVVHKLTKRELECLKWVAMGKSNWEISCILDVTEHAIVHHVRNIMRKFEVENRHQAVMRAVSLGLLYL